MKLTAKLVMLLTVVVGTAATACSQTVTVTGRVAPAEKASAVSSTVVWLMPVNDSSSTTQPVRRHPVLRQKNKAFEPHLLVVTRGSTVEFPNDDPWFHNVFSLFNGKRFDLGLYEAGSSRTVHFDREGVSYIFCNIHPEMSAVVVVLSSDHFAVPGKQGEFAIADVPRGRYTLHVWSENVDESALQPLAREVQISDNSHSLGTIRVPSPPTTVLAHKNKYGQDYEPPSPNNPVYVQQP
jgi:plastocyanin